jgi:tRNA (guanine37-N1)-methyltransferase
VHVHVLTLFPEALGSPLAIGPVRRARELGVLQVSLHQLRDYATDRHGTVDDVPYGGGQGMVLKIDPLVRAIEHVTAVGPMRRVLLSARGPRLTQSGRPHGRRGARCCWSAVDTRASTSACWIGSTKSLDR